MSANPSFHEAGIIFCANTWPHEEHAWDYDRLWCPGIVADEPPPRVAALDLDTSHTQRLFGVVIPPEPPKWRLWSRLRRARRMSRAEARLRRIRSQHWSYRYPLDDA